MLDWEAVVTQEWLRYERDIGVTMALRNLPVLSLRQLAMVKLAVAVCNDPDMQNFLKEYGSESFVFPSRETQIYVEKAKMEFEETGKLGPDETWAWRSFLIHVNFPRTLDITFKTKKIFNECDMKKGTLPFERWEELVEKKISSFSLPPVLRAELIDVIRSTAAEIDQWIKDNYRNLLHYLQEGRSAHCYFQWNSHGKIDREKTARTLINIEGLHNEDRFYLALHYGIIDDMFSYKFGKLPERLEGTCRWRYCAGLMWEACSGESDLKYIAQLNPVFQSTAEQNLQCINFLISKKYIQYEDLLFCLSQVSDDEREVIFKTYRLRILKYFLDWPFQCQFIEAAKRLLPYLTESDFRDILVVILYERITLGRKDFDYINLLREFWSVIPTRKKELIEKDAIYENLKYTLDYPNYEIFSNEKLIGSYRGNQLMFGYQGTKYFLKKIESPSKCLDSGHFTSCRDYKFCSIFYVCKCRAGEYKKGFVQELKTHIKQWVPAFFTKIRDFCHWLYTSP
ncbi:uncharacterized protein NPIL_464011 [Nephila pilipes]|uniref:Uncharacterized protein n=1 Tax=Nephila pilipes TaxID=299642 RepID=A0A8X6PG80_NEPPI|nr:uncharacterized protein NPIL_464011 [Nephila pilipes]